MGLFSDRAAVWIAAVADWLGFTVRKVLTTNPPPMSHKQQPRINRDWQTGKMVHLPPPAALPRIPEAPDPDKTPSDKRPTLPRHARKRPPPHDRGKS